MKKQKFKIKGVHTFKIVQDGKVVNEFTKENTIVADGRERVGRILAGLEAFTEGINYSALGTGATAIADTDSQLQAEGARKVRGSSQSNGDEFIVAFYYGPTEANGSWTRYGTFIDGTSTPNSGVLFSHVQVTVTKTEGQGLVINSLYTLSTTT